MFGHKSKPSRVYAYGAKAPTLGADAVDQQMRDAHRYRNCLVELERARRARVDATLSELSPDLVATGQAIEATEEQLVNVLAQIKRDNSAARARKANPEAKRQTTELRRRLRALRARRKELRQMLFSSSTWKAHQAEIQAWTTSEEKRLRAEWSDLIYWGSRAVVEQSMASARTGAPPRFASWTGDGHLAIQIQRGMATTDASSEDTRIQIGAAGEEGMPGPNWTPVRLRVGSHHDRSPVWCMVPVRLHRPLPVDARIKWVHLMRRRIATKCAWSVQFVLAAESAAVWAKPDCATSGTVGVDVGWRMRPDGSLRVAVWAGDDGDLGELALPGDWLMEMRKTEHIRSIRDRDFNSARGKLVRWLADNPEARKLEWMAERTQSLSQWRAPRRMAALLWAWKDNRIDGDDAILAVLEAWRHRDCHLYEYEGNLRDQLQARRKDLYRVFAAHLRRRYQTAIVEKLDLREFHVLPPAEEDAQDAALREHTRDACLSHLIDAISQSMGETVCADPKNTTRRCWWCWDAGIETLEDWDRRELRHECSVCGTDYDQDECAARNLLSSAEVVA